MQWQKVEYPQFFVTSFDKNSVQSDYLFFIVYYRFQIIQSGVVQFFLEKFRLILLRFSVAGAPLVYQLNSNSEVVKYLPQPGLESGEGAKKND